MMATVTSESLDVLKESLNKKILTTPEQTNEIFTEYFDTLHNSIKILKQLYIPNLRKVKPEDKKVANDILEV